jgi:hypothetical protein
MRCQRPTFLSNPSPAHLATFCHQASLYPHCGEQLLHPVSLLVATGRTNTFFVQAILQQNLRYRR